MKRTLRARHLLVFVCVAAVVALSSGTVAYRVALSGMLSTPDRSLLLTQRAIAAEIDRFRYLPAVAAKDIRVQRAIAQPDRPETIDQANRYLPGVAEDSGLPSSTH